MSLTKLCAAFEASPHHLAAFFVLGDPDIDTSLRLAELALELGCTQLELGLPFSDPCGDGPAVQRSQQRARAAGVSTEEALELLGRIRSAAPDVPLNLLVYGNLVHARGADAFCAAAAQSGASSLLTPDIPLPEAEGVRAACAAHDLGFVPLVGPATSPERLRESDAAATGFVYLAGHQGVTGARSASSHSSELVSATTATLQAPVCLGFGLKDEASIRQAFDSGARMAVVGSHLALAIERGLDTGNTGSVVDAVSKAIDPLTRSLKP